MKIKGLLKAHAHIERIDIVEEMRKILANQSKEFQHSRLVVKSMVGMRIQMVVIVKFVVQNSGSSCER